MANAIETQGFTLGISATGTSPITYTNIGEISNFSGFDGSAAEIDVTHLASTAKEFLMGLQDWGQFSIDTNYLPADAGQDLLRTAKGNRDIHYFKATFSDASYATFAGYVLSAGVSGGVDAKVDGNFVIRISGDVTFSA
jgi:hypothetical protein